MKDFVELKNVIQLLAKNHAWADINNITQTDIRHKSGATDKDYLKAFLSLSRCFGYATRDNSWGEFEKEFHIIVNRLIKAEQLCNDNGIELP